MPKIVAVQGVSNAGKSTAIVEAMNRLGLYEGLGGKDVLLCGHLSIGGVGHHIGFSSGGDTAWAVQRAVNFFGPRKLDCMVFACRTQGGSLAALLAYAQQLQVQPIFIPAQHVPTTAIGAHHQNLVRLILNNVP